MELVRTRQALGSQIRDALDTMVGRHDIKAWHIIAAPDGRTLYQLEGFTNNFSIGATPGEMADYLNARGFDIRFGKA